MTTVTLATGPLAHINISPLANNPTPDNSDQIPVIVGYQPPPSTPYQQHSPRPACLTTVRRDNRAVTALSLPNIMVTNHRSIFPKFNNLVDEIIENEMHLGLHSEIWESKENKDYTNKIEEALELHGIKYISTNRKDRREEGLTSP